MENQTNTTEVSYYVTEFENGAEHKTAKVIDFIQQLLSQDNLTYSAVYADVADTLLDIGLVDVDANGAWYLPDENETDAVEMCELLLVVSNDDLSLEDVSEEMIRGSAE